MVADAAASPPQAMTADEMLARVEAWVWELAYRNARACGVTASDFAHELRVDLFLHRHQYRPEKGKLTTWVAWRCRAVRTRFIHRRKKDQAVRLPATFAAKPDPDAAGGRFVREDSEAELKAAVRGALAGLTGIRRRRMLGYYGVCGAAEVSLEELAAADGVTYYAVRQALELGREHLAEDARLRRVARERGFACG